MLGSSYDFLILLWSLFFSSLSQGAQAVGMGKESHSVPAAADLFNRANDILGYDSY